MPRFVNSSLTSVDLSENKLKLAACKTICDMMTTNTTIRHLSLAGNDFDVQSVEAIAEMLQINRALIKISLGGDSKPFPDHEHTYEPVTMETTMTEADFSNRGLGSYASIIATFMPRCQ